MSFPIFDTLQSSLFGSFGDYTVLVLAILATLVVGFMFAGIDFRIAILVCMPVIIAAGDVGWVANWVVGLAWITVVGFGMFIVWNFFRSGG